MNEEIKKEARELVEKYLPFTRYDVQNDFRIRGYSFAKQCASIDIQNTIDELEKIENFTEFNSDIEKYVNEKIEKYNLIKQAIEQL